MKKRLAGILLLMFSIGIFIGCGGEVKAPEDVKNIKVMVPDGLPAMGAAKLIKDDKTIDKGYKVEYSIEKTPETLVSSVLKGKADIAIVPSNVAATAYNKGDNYKIAATTGWGSFYLISTDGVKDINELKGKEIYNIGKGLTPDIVTRELLTEMGYNVDKDFNFTYVNGVSELAPIILSGKAKNAVIPEPALSQVLAKKKNTNIVLNLNDEWKKLNKSEYGFPQATVIVKKDLLEKDKGFVNKFLEELNSSVNFALDNKNELSNICNDIGVSANKEIIPQAIEKSNIKYVPIKDSKKEYIDYFKKLYKFDPKSVGGKIPNENIFMEE